MSRNYELLSISPQLPYDSVRNAGGQLQNYYIKNIHKSLKERSIPESVRVASTASAPSAG